MERLNTSPRFISPYHSAANGLVERFQGSFQRLLHHAMRQHGRGWHKAVPFLVWAMREVPNATTGVSPFQLQFGIPPRGVLSLLKDTWVGQIQSPTNKSVSQYMAEMAKHLETVSEYADEHAKNAQKLYAKYYNVHAKDKLFEEDEQVLVLEKDVSSKVYAEWKTGKITR